MFLGLKPPNLLRTQGSQGGPAYLSAHRIDPPRPGEGAADYGQTTDLGGIKPPRED